MQNSNRVPSRSQIAYANCTQQNSNRDRKIWIAYANRTQFDSILRNTTGFVYAILRTQFLKNPPKPNTENRVRKIGMQSELSNLSQFFWVIFRNDTSKSTAIALHKFVYTELKKSRISWFYNRFSAASHVQKLHFSYIKPYVKLTQNCIFGAENGSNSPKKGPNRLQIGPKHKLSSKRSN